MTYTIIVARDSESGVSKEGNVPWLCPSSVATFRKIVRCGDLVQSPMETTHRYCFVVANRRTIKDQRPDCLIVCDIDGAYGCDAHITDDDLDLNAFTLWAIKRQLGCTWRVFVKDDTDVPPSIHAWHTEAAYLKLLRDVLHNGACREDRTGTGTRSVFGRQIEFDLSHGFPLITTKKTFWKGIVRELLWFLKGQTDAKILSKDGVRIWDGNTSASFLRDRGLDYQAGDAGPIYGFQWRHWGAEYTGCETDYRDDGHDQLKTLIRTLRTDPTSRRHVVSAWNVADLDAMALPPCHLLFQCYVTHDDRLDMHVYQRSVDIGLGLPFNIASYALLVHLICRLTGYAPGRLVMSLGDVHVYLDHIDALRQQIDRVPNAPPRVVIRPNRYSWLHEYKEADISLEDYRPGAPLPMAMAV